MPKSSLLIFDLSAMSSSRVGDVASFQVPENGPSLLAYLKGPKAGATPAAAAENDDVPIIKVARRTRRRARRGSGKIWVGDDCADLRVQRRSARSKTSPITPMAKDGKTLAYTVASKKEESNGAYAVVPGTDSAPVALLSGKGRYSKLTWDFAQKQMAFLSDNDDAAAKPPMYKDLFVGPAVVERH